MSNYLIFTGVALREKGEGEEALKGSPDSLSGCLVFPVSFICSRSESGLYRQGPEPASGSAWCCAAQPFLEHRQKEPKQQARPKQLGISRRNPSLTALCFSAKLQAGAEAANSCPSSQVLSITETPYSEEPSLTNSSWDDYSQQEAQPTLTAPFKHSKVGCCQGGRVASPRHHTRPPQSLTVQGQGVSLPSRSKYQHRTTIHCSVYFKHLPV